MEEELSGRTDRREKKREEEKDIRREGGKKKVANLRKQNAPGSKHSTPGCEEEIHAANMDCPPTKWP